MNDFITFAQLRACLQVASEMRTGETVHSAASDRLREACDRQGATYRLELDDVTALLGVFGRASARE